VRLGGILGATVLFYGRRLHSRRCRWGAFYEPLVRRQRPPLFQLCCKPLNNPIDRLFIRQHLWFHWMLDNWIATHSLYCAIVVCRLIIIIIIDERLRSGSWATVKCSTPKQQPTQKNFTNACCLQLEVFRVFGLPLSRIIQHSTWILVVSADTGADQSERGKRGQIPWIEHLRNNDDILCQILFFEQYNVKKSSLVTDVIHFSCARVRIARMRGYW
jgi:hypothetical protein